MPCHFFPKLLLVAALALTTSAGRVGVDDFVIDVDQHASVANMSETSAIEGDAGTEVALRQTAAASKRTTGHTCYCKPINRYSVKKLCKAKNFFDSSSGKCCKLTDQLLVGWEYTKESDDTMCKKDVRTYNENKCCKLKTSGGVIPVHTDTVYSVRIGDQKSGFTKSAPAIKLDKINSMWTADSKYVCAEEAKKFVEEHLDSSLGKKYSEFGDETFYECEGTLADIQEGTIQGTACLPDKTYKAELQKLECIIE